MLSRPHHSLYNLEATLFSVAQPLVAVSQGPLREHAATLHPGRILRDPDLAVAQVLGSGEPKSEPEQFLENKRLVGAKNQNLSNSLKTKDRVLAKFFLEKRT
jgi:hypothetical protein